MESYKPYTELDEYILELLKDETPTEILIRFKEILGPDEGVYNRLYKKVKLLQKIKYARENKTSF